MRIGELAKQAGTDAQTVRYYEREGLLDAPSRTASGYRAYGPQHVERLNFIRHARELGFDIEDIRQLLTLSAEPQESCHQVDSIARQHLDEIDLRIGRLEALRAELQRMVGECGHGRSEGSRTRRAQRRRRDGQPHHGHAVS